MRRPRPRPRSRPTASGILCEIRPCHRPFQDCCLMHYSNVLQHPHQRSRELALNVSWARNDGVLVARLVGRVDTANSMECAEILREASDSDERSLVLNLSELTYLSSAGLRILLMTARKFSGTSRAFAVCDMSTQIEEVIRISGFNHILSVHGSEAAAVEFVAGAGPGGAPS
ncbi:MAG: STAS domain-containing protein [Gemmatimonadetes bacterium]|nr:STAS domain-containing protein [Gemmatimonadota bacterium]MYJ39124.1 STAS domain-containing protein [Gemmatimonadota bacterium]